MRDYDTALGNYKLVADDYKTDKVRFNHMFSRLTIVLLALHLLVADDYKTEKVRFKEMTSCRHSV
jgi:hypothetical protein